MVDEKSVTTSPFNAVNSKCEWDVWVLFRMGSDKN